MVRLWHLADVSLALTNVCFGGKSGHNAGVTRFPLMTQSGHGRLLAHRCAGPDQVRLLAQMLS